MLRLVPAMLIFSTMGGMAAVSTEQAEFFEKRIRPILASECVECHGAEKQKGGLRLDYRDGWKAGGDTGPAMVPGEPGKSLLLKSIRHEDAELKMPSKRPKLSDGVIADFEKWIAMGAPDPRDEPAKDGRAVKWDSLLEDRKKWWSLQPVKKVAPPKAREWSAHPVDGFLLEKMEAAGLAPANDADAWTLGRRLSFALTGLPPAAEDVEAFVKEYEAEKARTGRAVGSVERLVERLLASPRFGERWARHWMDLVRYAETHGSEGDPEIPHAWRYRDYLVRAFNDDVPLDQVIREHVAGDLLAKPRWNVANGWNESVLGLAHLRMVEHGFQPVDTRDEQVKVVENQIDVLGKAFQGMTFACARCHDHKFDAVSQRDYYALAGVFESSRPALITIDAPEVLNRHRAELSALKLKIKDALAEEWLREGTLIAEHLLGAKERGAQMVAQQARIRELEGQLAGVDQTVRKRILAGRGQGKASGAVTPMPWARWSFDDAREQLAGLDGKLEGDAELRGGRLHLRGAGHLRSGPIGREMRAKTLEVWVTVATLDQAGGGTFSVEDARGNIFDSIVFAEKDPRLWMAGSDFFRRSERLKAPTESAGADQLVHLAITYAADGQTRMFRNGVSYGQAWKANEPPAVFAGDAHVLFGLRHTPAKGNGYFQGEIEEARLYDRALSAEEVRNSFEAGVALTAVSEEEIANGRTQEERKRREDLRKQMESARAELAQIAPRGKDVWGAAVEDARKDALSPLRAWVARGEEAKSEGAFDRGLPFRFLYGPGVAGTKAGEFCVLAEGEQAIGGLQPEGVGSGGLTRKHGGSATTQGFKITTDFISLRAAGRDAQVRLILDGYPLGAGQIFPRGTLNHDEARWVTLDVKYRKGARAYLEVATAEDLTRREKNGAVRSWFWVGHVVMHDGAAPKENAYVLPGAEKCASEAELAECFERTVLDAVQAWRMDGLSEAQRRLLDYFVRHELLPNGTEELKALISEFRRLEAEVTVPRRATGVVEAEPLDAPFLPRGDHLKPEAEVPRGYLGVFEAKQFTRENSGRLDLAMALTDARNPLTARVLVNRIWHHLFGRGLVSTPDNFGRMGEMPSHPELLDDLAERFVEEGWSLRKMVRFLVTSRAYQMASTPSAAAKERDPENVWLSHIRVRRLEAEAIRDALLSVSGRLDLTMEGPGVGGDTARRSIYVGVRRTNLDAFLEMFDAPKPFTTIGRRDATNVPGQSLALLNDPFVIQCAETWAGGILEKRNVGVEDRIREMFLTAFSRKPTASELEVCRESLAENGEKNDAVRATLGDAEGWRDLAQSLFNMKEFLYLK